MNAELKIFKKDIDIIGLHTFFYFEHAKDFYFSGERHDFWEMVYVDSGEVAVVAENTGYMIHQGEVIFHKPMEFHALAANKIDPHNVMILSFSTQSKAMGFFENKIFSLDGQQKKILARILAESNAAFGDSKENWEIGAPQLLMGYLEQFLIILIRSNQNSKRASRKNCHAKKNIENVLVNHIENYLAENIYNKLTLQAVCERFHMSKSYMCQLFKDSTGKSIIDCYIHLKIFEAKKLIRRGEYNFTQISEKLCYTSIHHFTRSFKQLTGVSPSSYAKSIKSDELV